MMDQSVAPEFFDRLYAEVADPWNYEGSGYERRKYTATLAALPRRKYRRGLEVGCSIGVLTHMLAMRCRMLLALDASAISLERARRRCGGARGVHFQRVRAPREWPSTRFDLIVLSEVFITCRGPTAPGSREKRFARCAAPGSWLW